jgi:hypothetical protein
MQQHSGPGEEVVVLKRKLGLRRLGVLKDEDDLSQTFAAVLS